MRYEDWPKITGDTSIEEVRRIHKMIWDIVVETGEKPCTPYRSDCALCEYSCGHFNDYVSSCYLCPAIWSESRLEYMGCMNPESPYHKWSRLHKESPIPTDKEIALAKAIRDIPFWVDKEGPHGIR